MKLGEVARLIGVTPRWCWRKQKWRSKGAAKAHLRALLRSEGVEDAKQLNTFPCPLCGWYHVGHSSKRGSNGR